MKERPAPGTRRPATEYTGWPLAREPEEISAALLAWYDANRRDLPWRVAAGETADPYRVWISEVMLQQTRVETVRPYYERWLRRFPDLETLAAADADDVLKAWEGLGYYSRARNLHSAVREVVDRYGAEVPREPETFASLPGVGRYTTGAVMSIAFGQPEPVVDGNVRRVFARLLDDPDPPARRLWDLAAELLPAERPGDHNQALMELGATICTPRTPQCGECPVASHCRAFAKGTVATRPAPKRKSPVRVELHGVAAVESGGRLLFVRRPVNGRLGGLWELPGIEAGSGESAAEAARRAAMELGGVDVAIGARVGRVRHVFTHVTVDYDVYRAAPDSPPDRGETADRAWVGRSEIERLSLPSAQHRILTMLAASAPPLPVSPGSRR